MRTCLSGRVAQEHATWLHHKHPSFSMEARERRLLRLLSLALVLLMSIPPSSSQAPASCPKLPTVLLDASAPATTGCCGTSTQKCHSLASAVSVALPSGATVTASAGTYTVPAVGLEIGGSTLTITAAPGLPLTSVVIDCANGPCLTASCTDASTTASCATVTLTLQGVSLRNGKSAGDGGCLRVSNQSVSLSNVALDNCVATLSGGGVAVSQAPKALMQAVSVTNCTALAYAKNLGASDPVLVDSGGGAIALNGVDKAVLSSLTIQGCSAKDASGGGLLLLLSPSVSLSSSSISSSYANVQGGCVASANSSISLNAVNMTSCQAGGGGCYADSYSSSLSITASTFSLCTSNFSLSSDYHSHGGGGILLLSTSSTSLQSSQVLGALADNQGGGLAAAAIGNLSLNQLTVISNCTSYTAGGGAHINGATSVQMAGARFEQNQASSILGTTNGGGVVLIDAPASLDTCIFTGNDATSQANPAVLASASNGVEGLSQGGAVYVEQSSVTFTSCFFKVNRAIKGGGLYADSSSVVQDYNSSFANNLAEGRLPASSGEGGGAVFWGSASLTGSHFTSNVAPVQGGGVSVEAAVGVEFSDCTFAENSALSSSGGGVAIPQTPFSNVSFSTCTFFGNNATGAAGAGGGLAVNSLTGLLTLSDSHFNANSAAFQGGAVQALGSLHTPGTPVGTPATSMVLNASRTDFNGNTAGLSGGALSLSVGMFASMDSCTFQNNAARLGGAIVVDDISSLTLSFLTCKNNIASMSGGCLSSLENGTVAMSGSVLQGNNGTDQGGAISLGGFSSLSLSSNTSFLSNWAMGGGAIWAELGSSTTAHSVHFLNNIAHYSGGGVAVLHKASMSMSSSSFSSNQAAEGGAAVVLDLGTLTTVATNFSSNTLHAIAVRGKASLSLTGGLLSYNSADSPFLLTPDAGMGGAIFTTEKGTAAVSNATFLANVAKDGAAISAALNSSVSASNCTFFGNAADDLGGGVYAQDMAVVDVSNSTFVNNTAQESGAGVALAEGASGKVSSSSFLGNAVSQMGAGVYLERDVDGSGSQGSSAAGSAGLLSGNATSSPPSSSSSPYSYQPVAVSGLLFSGSVGGAGQGSAFFDASFLPALRSSCANCSSPQPLNNTIGSLPSTMQLLWQEDSLNSSQSGAAPPPLPVMADIVNPITDLTVLLFDSSAQLATSGFTGVVEVQADERISGDLQTFVKEGKASFSPIAIRSGADTSTNFTLAVVVSSPSGSFPAFGLSIQVSFCSAGYYLDSTTYQCLLCPIGSWCATGQGAQYCPDGSYTFFPGQSDPSNCSTCPDTVDPIAQSSVMTCSQGNASLITSWYLDNSTLLQSPSVYPCDISTGCTGMLYAGPDTPQCDDTYYQETLLCSVCASENYKLLYTCNSCANTSYQLFVLWSVLLVLLWLVSAVMSASFHSLSIFIQEVQVLAVLGSLSLNYPPWITTFINLCIMMLLDPAITGIGCFFTWDFKDQWLFTFVVAAVGVAAFLLCFLLLRLLRSLRTRSKRRSSCIRSSSSSSGDEKDGAPEASQVEGASNPLEFKAIRGLFNWLDLCYLPLTIRCVQAIYSVNFSGYWALGFDPQVQWWSPTCQLLFFIAVPLLLLYTVCWPLGFVGVLVRAKQQNALLSKRMRVLLGGLLTRYESKYFWWHLVLYILRIYYACVFVLLHTNPGLQLGLIIPAQVLRLGLQFAASPFTAGSIDLLSSSLALAEVLFTISITGMNYLFQGESPLILTGFIISLALMAAAVALTFSYECVGKFVGMVTKGAVKRLWKRALKRGDGDADAEEACGGTMARPLINPKHVADWFRDTVVGPVVLCPQRKDVHQLLLRVCVCYERALTQQHAGSTAKDQGLFDAEFSDVVWLKGLKKSQMFAALHQVVLAVKVKDKVVAEAPSTLDDLAAWVEALEREKANGVDLSASRTLARFRKVKSKRMGGGGGSLRSGPPGFSQAVGRSGRSQREGLMEALAEHEEGEGREGESEQYWEGEKSKGVAAAAAEVPASDKGGAVPELPPTLPLPASTSPHLPPPAATSEPPAPPSPPPAISEPPAPSPATISLPPAPPPAATSQPPAPPSPPPAAPAPPPAFASQPPVPPAPPPASPPPSSDPALEAPADAPPLGPLQQQPASRFARSLSDDEDCEPADGVPPCDKDGLDQAPAGDTAAGGPVLTESLSQRMVEASVRLVDERPEELWPPPLDYRATWVVRRSGEDGEGGESGRVDAVLSSMGLALAFQESFGQLTLVEKKNRPHALRHLVCSSQINNILGWLSSPACTTEDRELFVELLESLQQAAVEDAGSLEWGSLVCRVFKAWFMYRAFKR